MASAKTSHGFGTDVHSDLKCIQHEQEDAEGGIYKGLFPCNHWVLKITCHFAPAVKKAGTQSGFRLLSLKHKLKDEC